MEVRREVLQGRGGGRRGQELRGVGVEVRRRWAVVRLRVCSPPKIHWRCCCVPLVPHLRPTCVTCQLIGASVDSVFSHLAWIQTPRNKGGLGGLAYPLLSGGWGWGAAAARPPPPPSRLLPLSLLLLPPRQLAPLAPLPPPPWCRRRCCCCHICISVAAHASLPPRLPLTCPPCRYYQVNCQGGQAVQLLRDSSAAPVAGHICSTRHGVRAWGVRGQPRNLSSQQTAAAALSAGGRPPRCALPLRYSNVRVCVACPMLGAT